MTYTLRYGDSCRDMPVSGICICKNAVPASAENEMWSLFLIFLRKPLDFTDWWVAYAIDVLFTRRLAGEDSFYCQPCRNYYRFSLFHKLDSDGRRRRCHLRSGVRNKHYLILSILWVFNPPPPGGSDPTPPPLGFFRNNFFIYYCIDMKPGTPLRASIWRRLVQRKSNRPEMFCFRSNSVTSLHAILGR